MLSVILCSTLGRKVGNASSYANYIYATLLFPSCVFPIRLLVRVLKKLYTYHINSFSNLQNYGSSVLIGSSTIGSERLNPSVQKLKICWS